MTYRTLPISTGDDRNYSCVDCQIDDLDRGDVDERDWTCKQCGNPVHIDLADDFGNHVLVVRQQAQNLKVGHYVYLEHDWVSGALCVMDSKPAMKTNMWFLAIQKFRGITVEPDRNFNCVISGDMV